MDELYVYYDEAIRKVLVVVLVVVLYMSARLGVGLTVSLGHEFLPVQSILGSGTTKRYLPFK